MTRIMPTVRVVASGSVTVCAVLPVRICCCDDAAVRTIGLADVAVDVALETKLLAKALPFASRTTTVLGSGEVDPDAAPDTAFRLNCLPLA